MIAKGSRDETETRRQIVLWQGMSKHWNELADDYRRMGRGKLPATAQALDEAEGVRDDIRSALERCDLIIDDLAPGHEYRSELFQVAGALEALSASIAISIEQMGPRIEQAQDVAGLKYLVSALRRDAEARARSQ